MRIINQLLNLKLPTKEFVVIGSGTMDILGIRPAQDIDLVISQKLFNILQNNSSWKKIKQRGEEFLIKGNIEAGLRLDFKVYRNTFNSLHKEALVVEGIHFMNLKELVKMKTAMGREKDIKDIKKIQDYLLKNKVRFLV